MKHSVYQRMRQVLLVGTILMIGASMGLAQSVTTGTVTGTVSLPDGSVSAGTNVVLEGKAAQRSTVTDQRGKFVFLSVLPGNYTVVTALAGFNTDRIETVVSSGTTIDLAIELSIATVEGEIVVTSMAPIVDTRKSSVDTTFNDELLTSIPTARDTFYDLATTAAGMAVVSSVDSWLPSPAAYGSATSNNIFLVDGVNTTNPRGPSWGSLVRVNYDTVQEVKILSLGAQAEYGSFSGAAMDVITKSGGNEFHGTGGYYTQLGDAGDNYTQNIGPDWIWVNPDDSIVTLPESSDEFAATIGGPILKDKVWFYAGYQDTKSETDTPNWEPLSTWKSQLIDFKLTADIADNHRLWAGYHVEDNRGGNISWGPWEPTMRYDSLYDNTTLSLHYQWIASDRDLVGFKYLGFKTDQLPTIPSELGHPGYINWWKWIGGLAVGVNGDFPYIEGTENQRTTIQADYTHYADDWAGTHEIKFGVQYTSGNGDWVGGYFQNYANFAYPYGWAQTRDYFANAWWVCDETWCLAPTDQVYLPFYNRKTWNNPYLTERQANSTGFFVDDQWVVNNRLTLNLGLRFDKSEAKYGKGLIYEYFDSPSDIHNPTVLRTRAGQDVYDFDSWAPRIGFAYDLTGDGKTVLRGHIGRYYDPISVDALRKNGPDAAQGLIERYFYLLPWDQVDTNANGYIDQDEVAPATALLYDLVPNRLMDSTVTDNSWTLQVEPGTKQPYTDQFNLSLQRQLTRDLAIEVSYIYKISKDMLVLRPYDPATGEFYEWESIPYTTSAGYESQIWSIVLEDYNGDGVVNWSGDGNYVASTGANAFYRVINVNSFDGHDVHQKYQGLQVVLNKRYSDRWQGMLALNYTDTDGFYPRIVNQNWYIGGPLTQDTPFGSSYNHFQNNLSGPALMTPKVMAKIAASYTIPVIEADLGFRLRYDSGRAIWLTETPQNYANWMGDNPPAGTVLTAGWGHDMIAIDPEKNDWMPSTTIIDLSLHKRFGLPNGMGLGISLDAFNAFNEATPTSIGYKTADYGRVYSLNTPRIYRLGLKFDF